MRCRFCNKSISLLRRLNDAEFCSDAHRFSYAEEQQLAMQRLSETQSPLQRAQRMAGARAQTAPVKEFSDTGRMTVSAEHLGIQPPAIASRFLPHAIPDTLATASLVLFMDRDHRFQARLPFVPTTLALARPVRAHSAAPAAVVGYLPQLRITLPRTFASRPRRCGGFREGNGKALARLGLTPPDARMRKRWPVLEPLAPALSLPAKPAGRRERSFAAITRLRSVPLPPCGIAAHPAAPAVDRTGAGLFGPARLCMPSSRLKTILPAPPPPPEETPEERLQEFWSIVESTPLQALEAATRYTTVLPVRPETAFCLAADTRPAEFPPLDTAFTGSLSALHAVHVVFALGLEPVSPTAARPTAIAAGTGPELASPEITGRLPERQVARRQLSLPRPASVHPVAAPAATDCPVPAWHDSRWAWRPAAASIPANSHTLALPGLPDAAAVPLAAPSPAPGKPKATASLASLRYDVPGLRPASQSAQPATVPFPAAAVAWNYVPGIAGSPLKKAAVQELRTVLRPSLPSHTSAPVHRYAGAECVALSAPPAQPPRWQALAGTSSDLCPELVLPVKWKPEHSKAPRAIPPTLFRVPNAQPMARPSQEKCRLFGLGAWGGQPAICAVKLRFDDGKRAAKGLSAREFGRELRERFSKAAVGSAWQRVSHLPSDLKWIAMVVPLIVGIWALALPSSSTPVDVKKVPVAVKAEPEEPVEAESRAAVAPVSIPQPLPAKPAAKGEKAPAAEPVAPAEPSRWDILTARIAGRASVDLVDDFRNGLSLWEGRGEWARSWSYDKSGTVRPGHMAIFQPSVGLHDYVLEMKASIERRAIQWMVRASNPQNYHFARLNVTPGAPLTRLELERWSVVNGHTGRVTRLPLPHGGANQTLYSIRVEVKGDSITTYLQDQVIDTFNDTRLSEGGVGLMGAPDDRPRIYGIHVFHQNDFLGKLCSFLAPPPINNQGSD